MAGVKAVLSKLSTEMAERREMERVKGDAESKLFERMADQGDAYVLVRGDTSVIASFLSRRGVQSPMDRRATAVVQERIDAILNHREWKRKFDAVHAEIEAMPKESVLSAQVAEEDLAIVELVDFWMQKKRDLLSKLEVRRAKITEWSCIEQSLIAARRMLYELSQ